MQQYTTPKSQLNTAKIIATRPDCVYKIQAKDTTGQWAYYFVYIDKKNKEIFNDVIESGKDIDITNYGNIIASCYGEEVSQEVKQYLKDSYNFEV